MKIGLDIMGGDHAPIATTKGAILAKKEMPPDVELVLIGDKQAIETTCREENFDPGNFIVVPTTEEKFKHGCWIPDACGRQA
jgi:glycerol-3-phosphate acyltransferase PlsX